MKNLNRIAIVLFAFTLLISCQETVDETIDDVKEELKEDLSEEIEELDLSPENVIDGPQTTEERIAEIKKWYGQIQKSPNQSKDCVSKSRTTIDYSMMEEGIPFENTAKKCSLEDGLSYKQITLEGYEWAETANFYYKNNQRFFTFVTGGAEAYGYEYRVYYDENGDVIRVLLSENDYDGQEVSSPFEVKEEGRKKEILNSVEHALKEMKSLLGE